MIVDSIQEKMQVEKEIKRANANAKPQMYMSAALACTLGSDISRPKDENFRTHDKDKEGDKPTSHSCNHLHKQSVEYTSS